MGQKVIFIDRDGVINLDSRGMTDTDYITCWDDFHFIPGVFEAFKKAHDAGYKCIIISNQQCVGKGLITVDGLEEITQRMKNEIELNGGRIDAVYYCIHLKEEDCPCRKPKTGNFERAARENGVELSTSLYYIGDTEKDIMAGHNAGLTSILVLSGHTGPDDYTSWQDQPDEVFPDLNGAVEFIINSEKKEQ